MINVRAAIVFTLAIYTYGCAHAPARVQGMNSAELQEVPLSSFCYSLAFLRDTRRPALLVEAEFIRRGASCAKTLGEVVSDCSMLSVRNPDIQAAQYLNGVVADINVVNVSNYTKEFHIIWDGRHLSPLYSIGPNAVQQYSVPVPERYAQPFYGEPNQYRARRAPYFQDCVNKRGSQTETSDSDL